MSKVEAYQLSHPELLSEETLCDILKNVTHRCKVKSCIVLPSLKTLGKEELIEIFKRIALPLPQRRYNEARTLGKSLNDLRVKRGINAATYHSENKDIPTTISPSNDSKNQREDTEDCSTKNRLKPPISEKQQITKKIRLSNSCQMEDLTENDAKRKSEVSSHPDSKKRQKITWP